MARPIQAGIHGDPLERNSLESHVDSDREVRDLDLFFLSCFIEDGEKRGYRLIHRLPLMASEDV